MSTDKKAEWLKVLGKGMITLPKKWRDEVGIEAGDVVKAKKGGSTIVIELPRENKAPYRVFSDAEIEEFLKEDKLPKSLAAKVADKLSTSSRP
ncbi:MAG: hypothetical protein A2Y57_04480 [Candidatus Woykebacteria bacterium RBG_13_40_7b]|uniref:SpoVT-AbrB domain-containing protein n=1 Tax=Candidatus Woykebacteria bacterium RBG_13_40_7b TaxID=1802594 RepID=A0A1G1W7U6_9BACT|nr:MAG: hypothetical protein A2Y57_04480 [Candidatus Woykebacteria bacterium RBG_13_40_7b]